MPVTTAQGVELSKQIGATYYIECSSRTQQVKTTNPKKYCVCPNVGVLLPRTARNVTVTMQAPKEAPPDLQWKDKFLLQSVVALDGATTKDITQETLNKEDGKVVEEFKLRVIYIPANPPSPVPEES
ncbi:vesicle-associated protein 1-3-like isoform X2 [Juglans microcarpa x Juglans regia]|uniref:vesicle-associated protein 1-3-like isoform X2 n=1 Tax=Juglans microcarpa x Juglans regia TaxID=2249226 RepID=UPI001B7F6D09|nr:vesicle-associated protein 1-3-like isoform X2 [Juglans microcarpa x Juglans regia]XP_041009126.1 vesicle-associated protein 1-3-like isoform X2 [Juglans microcarpa x Juglans regia]XP_041009127.1 vesicle-associated protein 1-3-like isoform X2 [Juglans microcarpa x Juglans regia]